MKASNGVEGNWMFPKLPALFDDFFTRDFFDLPVESSSTVTQPAVNVHETSKAYEFEMAAPGLDKKDFKVELHDNTLVISAQRQNTSEERNDRGRTTRKEFSYQTFSRSFGLPAGQVDASGITARYTDGILYVTVPKTPQAMQRVKEIKVS
jgi:HSP20 family protein